MSLTTISIFRQLVVFGVHYGLHSLIESAKIDNQTSITLWLLVFHQKHKLYEIIRLIKKRIMKIRLYSHKKMKEV